MVFAVEKANLGINHTALLSVQTQERGERKRENAEQLPLLLLRRQQCRHIIIQISTRKLRIIFLVMGGLAALCA